MTLRTHSLLSLLTVLYMVTPTQQSTTHNILNYGARPDGRTDSSAAFLGAWSSACSSNPGTGSSPAVIYIPKGVFLLGKGTFRGPCKGPVELQIDGRIVAPEGLENVDETDYHEHWVEFDGVTGVSIRGGVLDGSGAALWACKRAGNRCPAGLTTLAFHNSRDVTVSGLTSTNSQLYHIVVNRCDRVSLSGLRILAPESSPNTDGVHVQQSTGVVLKDSTIGTGDDCVSVGPGTSGLWIQRVACGPGHGISIGSLGKNEAGRDGEDAGVQNVTVTEVWLRGTTNGVRIKTWGRPSGGAVTGVVFQHAAMTDVRNPIIIDQNYCPHGDGCPNMDSGVRIAGVTYEDVHGTSATPVAVRLDCSRTNPCTGIVLRGIRLTYTAGNERASSVCYHARGNASGIVSPPSCLSS